MSTRIKDNVKTKQFIWFAALWLAGFMSMFLVSMLIKALMFFFRN